MKQSCVMLVGFFFGFSGQPTPPQLLSRADTGQDSRVQSCGCKGSAAQTSTEEAWRRQRDDSDGTSWRLISLPSSRTVCSLEKLVTSTTLQKLPRVNSGGRTGQRGGWQLTSSFQERTTSAWGLYENMVDYLEIKNLLQGSNSELTQDFHQVLSQHFKT